MDLPTWGWVALDSNDHLGQEPQLGIGQLLSSVSKTCSGPSAWPRVVILRVWSLPLSIIQELVRNAPAQTC